MIERLSIRNLALLETADLDFGPGLTVFTGETGAGKSLMISALDLISGGRASKDMVRSGTTAALVEAVVTAVAELLPEKTKAELVEDGFVELEEDGSFPDSIILSREVAAQGKNYCRINGRLVSLQRLHEIGTYLLDIQSQRDQAALYDVRTHLPLLDRFAGEKLSEAFYAYQKILNERKKLLQEQKLLGGNPAQRARELDLLQYQITEIAEVEPRVEEDEKLRKHRALYQNSSKIMQAVEESLSILRADDEDALQRQVDYLSSRLNEVAALDERWQSTAERLALFREELYELAESIEQQKESIEYKPELLEKIETRLNQLADLKRKYGPELSDVRHFREDAERRRGELQEAEERLQLIDAQLNEQRVLLQSAADRLSEARKAAAERLSAAIEGELASLGMKDAKFAIDFSEKTAFSSQGQDQLQFMISTNPGEGFKALAKIASGGESARILLAIKLILTSGHPNATLIFDEIDSGVSGQTCTLIGEKLLRLSVENQVFCVTHSAQIAACGHSQLLIEKNTRDGRTQTQIKELNLAERHDELARLLSGEEASGAAAEVVNNLLEKARKFDQSLFK